jgi:DNA (cytosine-5)-methyltransferase 1
MENVRGMMRVEKQIEEDIETATHQQYFFSPLLLDAQKFNIPQSRARYVMIGCKDVFFIEQIKRNIRGREKLKSDYTLKDALLGLPPLGTNPHKLKIDYESETVGYAARKIVTEENEYLRGINRNFSGGYLFNHKSRYNNENDLEIFRLLPEGENSLHESISHLNKYKNRDHIFADKYYKLRRDEVSKTITSHMKYDCHMYIHPEQPRGLSPREAARIQSFPDDYIFRGDINDWYRQIGNAVPVKIAEIIANEIRNYYQ